MRRLSLDIRSGANYRARRASAARAPRSHARPATGKEHLIEQADPPIRHDPPRRHAGRGHVPLRRTRSCASRTRSTRSASTSSRPASRARTRRRRSSSSCSSASASRHAADLRLRHDAPARRRRPPTTRRCALLARLLRARLHAGRQDLEAAPGEGDPHRARGEPRADRATRSPILRRAGQARDLRRRALLRRLPRRPRLRAALPRRRRSTPGAENVTLCDTNGSSLPLAGRGGDAPRSSSASARERVGIHTHNDAECGVANSIAAVEEGASLVQGTMNGLGERCGNANLVSILPSLQLKLGYSCVTARAARLAHQDGPPRRRALQPDAGPEPALRRAATRSPTRAACTSPACAPTRARSSTSSPEVVGNRRELLVSELSGKGTVLARAEEAGIELDSDARRARGRAAQGARAPRLPLRGGRRLLRPAAAQGGGRLRAALPPRELPRDHREARGRQGPDRGDDQDLGRAASGSSARPRATAR